MILGLDWGQKKIGMAVVYEEVPIAASIGIIVNDKKVFVHLKKIIEKYDVSQIVIGRSSHVSQNDNTKQIELFGEQCHQKFGLPIEYASEMFSTKEAHQNLKMSGKKNLSQIDDAEAARIILQQYMDAQKEKI